MKVLLMHRETDFDGGAEPPPAFEELVADLGLDGLIDAMAQGDEVVARVARQALSDGLADEAAILYRQGALTDALRNPEVVRGMYELAAGTVGAERKHHFGLLRDHPDTILRRSVEVMQMFGGRLRALRGLVERNAATFESEAFGRLFSMLRRELDEPYMARIDGHLRDLRFRNGLSMSARLGPGNQGSDYVLRQPRRHDGNVLRRWLRRGPPSYGFTIPERDDNGFRALEELRDRGVDLVANALAQSNDHILGFFRSLRDELAFYAGAVTLHQRLADRGEPACFPTPCPRAAGRLRYEGLYDPALSLQLSERAVGNDLDADGKRLIVITGANHGGKSTFLRALGTAQLMARSGLFVAARRAEVSVAAAVFSHFKREEDTELESGKLDEELRRLAGIVDGLGPGSLLLLNESFASTNEREGSEIARQVVGTLLERGVCIHFVTHLYDFARSMAEARDDAHLFLRAPRADDGSRSFRLERGEPLPTAYGEDLYREVFGTAGSAAAGSGGSRATGERPGATGTEGALGTD